MDNFSKSYHPFLWYAAFNLTTFSTKGFLNKIEMQ